MHITASYYNLILQAANQLKAESQSDPSKLASSIANNTTNDIEGKDLDSNQT